MINKFKKALLVFGMSIMAVSTTNAQIFQTDVFTTCLFKQETEEMVNCMNVYQYMQFDIRVDNGIVLVKLSRESEPLEYFLGAINYEKGITSYEMSGIEDGELEEFLLIDDQNNKVFTLYHVRTSTASMFKYFDAEPSTKKKRKK